MRLETLRIQGLRCLTDVSLAFAEGINVLVGANGAGKTSVLEAAFLLSHARSFRQGARDALLQRGASALSIFAQIMAENGGSRRLGLGRSGSRWEARVDGSTVPLGQLVGQCAVVCFDPGTHALIAGAAEERRRYLDWGVFHVEQGFLDTWRRYQRALKQRNSLLRAGDVADGALFEPWEAELATTADDIEAGRQRYLAALRPHLEAIVADLLPELGAMELRYRRGWPEERELLQVLRSQRGRDFARGHTTTGAHRADWSLAFAAAPTREQLSRGQEKLSAVACVLAQAALYAQTCGEWPVVCLDDLASELDRAHQGALVSRLRAAQAQILMTGTTVPEALLEVPIRRFHVEHGQITRLL